MIRGFAAGEPFPMHQPSSGQPPAAPRHTGHGWSQTFSSLRYRNFRLLWATTVLVAGGNWVQQVTLSWLAYDVTGSPLKVAIVLGLRTLPMLMSPMAGVLADRFDRRKLLLLDQTLLAFLALGFSILILSGNLLEWHMYAFSFLAGVGWAMNNPLRQTLVGNSVPREELMNAIAVNSMAFNAMRLIGPGVGGFLIQFFGPGINFSIQAVMYLGVWVVMLPYKPEFGAPRKNPRGASALSDLKEGFGYVLHTRVALFAMILSLVPTLSLMGFLTTQLPVYADEVLGYRGQDGGGALGLLLMSMGFGGLLGTLMVARMARVEHKGRVTIIGVFGAAAMLLVLSRVEMLWLAMAMLVVQQLFFIMVMTTNQTILQTITPDDLRGRVMGVYMLDVGFQPLGGVVAGVIASTAGVQTAWVVGSVIGLTAVTLVATFGKTFRRLTM